MFFDTFYMNKERLFVHSNVRGLSSAATATATVEKRNFSTEYTHTENEIKIYGILTAARSAQAAEQRE